MHRMADLVLDRDQDRPSVVVPSEDSTQLVPEMDFLSENENLESHNFVLLCKIRRPF